MTALIVISLIALALTFVLGCVRLFEQESPGMVLTVLLANCVLNGIPFLTIWLLCTK